MLGLRDSLSLGNLLIQGGALSNQRLEHGGALVSKHLLVSAGALNLSRDSGLFRVPVGVSGAPVS
jgi:hypothetical protein